MTMMPALSDDDVKLLLSDTLRLYVGQGRRLSWADLAAATGDDERKLRSYVERDPAAMPGPVFMRVFAVLPPDAFGRVANRMGFAARPIDVEDHAAVRRTLTAASRFVTKGNEALEDGVIDHRERQELMETATKLMPQIAQIAGGHC